MKCKIKNGKWTMENAQQEQKMDNEKGKTGYENQQLEMDNEKLTMGNGQHEMDNMNWTIETYPKGRQICPSTKR